MSDLENEKTKSLSQLLEILDRHFDQSELHTMAFELGVDYEDLPGLSKSDKARSLITHLDRRGRLLELVQFCRTKRPKVDWKEFSEEEASGVASHSEVKANPLNSSTSMQDSFMRYELGLDRLQAQVDQKHTRYGEFLVYQHRLLENLTQTRRYGDTETRRSERSEIIDRLNELSLLEIGVSFNEISL